jgi:carbon-monoxide dehydrogenase small subunit
MQINVNVNGEPMSTDVEPRVLLVHVIRDSFGQTGTHWGCDTSNCGACVVLLDGIPVKSCTVLGVMADGRRVDTIEGLETAAGLDPIQEGFMQCHGLQCGFCTPGMMLVGKALIKQNPNPSEHEIREAISGQLCRCTGYDNIVKSIQWAAAHQNQEISA